MYHGERETPHIRNKYATPFTMSGKSGLGGKRSIVALVERGSAARAYHVRRVTTKKVREILVTKASRKSRLRTDETNLYPRVGEEFAKHETVTHSAQEYARGDVITNSVEDFFGIFERGLTGVYQDRGEQHLRRYLAEFVFRYSNRIKFKIDDNARAVLATCSMDGKWLTYRRVNAA